VRKKIAMACATALVAVALTGAGAQSASAQTYTSYCIAHLYDVTALQAVPNTALYCQMQAGAASNNGYTGPVNGILATNSWKGIQTYLHLNWQYTGPINGVPGINTYKAMQRAANAYGWWYPAVLPIDGAMDLRDWQGWAYVARYQVTGE
jgi:hypothetical protein